MKTEFSALNETQGFVQAYEEAHKSFLRENGRPQGNGGELQRSVDSLRKLTPGILQGLGNALRHVYREDRVTRADRVIRRFENGRLVARFGSLEKAADAAHRMGLTFSEFRKKCFP